MLKPVSDCAAAQWVVDALDVGSPHLPGIVPPLYERYVRIVHPGWNDPEASVEGTMPRGVSRPLRRILSTHTLSQQECWFGVWAGYGLMYKPGVPDTVSIDTGWREWDLLRGPIDVLDFRFFVEVEKSVNIAWPENKSWFVATEIDICSTYVGGSKVLIRDLSNAKDLEVLEASVSDDVFRDNDRLREVADAQPANWR